MSTNQRNAKPARPAEGSTIDVPGYGPCEVLPHTDPGAVLLRTAHGATVRIGEKALGLALLSAEGADVRPTT
jgi:hypothetical protein